MYTIIQNCCIETWMLGNKKIYPRNNTSSETKKYTSFYDVRKNDPEKMSKPKDFSDLTSMYHYDYLRHILKDKNILYSKANPEATNINHILII